MAWNYDGNGRSFTPHLTRPLYEMERRQEKDWIFPFTSFHFFSPQYCLDLKRTFFFHSATFNQTIRRKNNDIMVSKFEKHLCRSHETFKKYSTEQRLLLLLYDPMSGWKGKFKRTIGTEGVSKGRRFY